MLPKNFQLQFSTKDISGAVERLGADISDWAHAVWEDSHTDIVAVPILRGGIFFFADLVRSVKHSMEIAPAKAWAYDVETNTLLENGVQVDIDTIPIKGRVILLVDDICDSGNTLRALKEAFLKRGAREVRSAVLIHRKVDPEIFRPDWIGFEHEGAEWFVGYGMDDCDRFRNLPDIHIIRNES